MIGRAVRAVRRARARRVATAILLATAAAIATRPARAQPSAHAVGAGHVELTVVGDAAALRWARSLVGTRGLGGQSPRWERADSFDPRQWVAPAAGAPPAPLRCWLDLTDGRRARLYFASPSGQRFLLRQLELSGRFDAVDREAVAEALEASVTALLEDEQAGVTRAEAEAALAARDAAPPPAGAEPRREPPAPATSARTDGGAAPAIIEPAAPALAAPSPAPARSLVVTVGVAYAAQAFSSDFSIAHGPGLAMSAGQAPAGRRWAVAGWGSVSFRWPETEQRPEIGVSLETVAARAGVELGRALGRRDAPAAGSAAPSFSHFLTARLGIGADAVHVAPEAGTGPMPATLTPGRWSSSLALTAGLGDMVPIGRHAYVAARLFADVLPAPVDYQVSAGGRVETVLTTWRLRPGLALEVGVF